MSEPFLGCISIFGFNFAPRDWARCDGQLLPINQNQSLFAILGTTYGGDGRTSFGLPDLRGRAPMHAGNGPGLTNRQRGQKPGAENVTLSANQIAAHTHDVHVSADNATAPTPQNNLPAPTVAPLNVYGSPPATLVAGAAGQVTGGDSGGSGHDNMQPYNTLNFCIALRGLFPSRN